jgi:DNA-binding CsgD family transcriptional regulator
MEKLNIGPGNGWRELRRLVDQTLEANSVDDLHGVGMRLSELFGYDHFLFQMEFAISPVAVKSIVVCNHPDWWSKRYTERNYHVVDPIARHCLSHSVPIELSEAGDWVGVPGEVRDTFLADAQSAGLRSGFGVPLHGINGEWGMLLLNSDHLPGKDGRGSGDAVPFVMLLATYLQQSARRIVLDRSSMLPDYNLTRREKECLVWAAEGKTSWETAKILSISERTVVYHLQNSIEKLAVANRTQAVAKASSLLLVDPELANVRKDRLGEDRRLVVRRSGGAETAVTAQDLVTRAIRKI